MLKNVRSRSWTTALALALATAPTLDAQRARVGSSNPSGLATQLFNRDLVFAAGDDPAGVELYYWTGTGTPSRVADVYPGRESSYPTDLCRHNPAGNETWFVARSPGAGRELHHWPSLSGAGTLELDIRSGPASSNPSELSAVGGIVFFTADDGVNGRELWYADAATRTVALVADVEPGPTGSSPYGLTPVGGKLVFAATTSAHGTELWVADPVARTASLLADIEPGPTGSNPGGFARTPRPGTPAVTYFSASTAGAGRELWSTDGASASMVADVEPGAASSDPDLITNGPFSMFTARVNGTRTLHVYFPGNGVVRACGGAALGSTITELTPALFGCWFRASDGVHGYELWYSDLTTATMVHDLQPGPRGSRPENLVHGGLGRVYFRCDDGVHGIELWQADLGAATRLTDLRSGSADSRPSRPEPQLLGEPLVFAAKSDGKGRELWQVGGSSVSLVSDVDADTPLPTLHIEEYGGVGGNLDLEITEAPASSIGVLFVSTGLVPPIQSPFLRGSLLVDLGTAGSIGYVTSATGDATIAIAIPSTLTSPAFAFQSFTLDALAAIFEASNTFACTERTGSTMTGSAGANGWICVDDESGEYRLLVESTTPAVNAWVGVYRYINADVEPILLYAFPLEGGEIVEREGRVEFKLRQLDSDLGGDQLEMRLFTAPPTQGGANLGNQITISYC